MASSAAWQTATIARIERQTPNAISVFLAAGIAPWLAGQHVDLRLTAPDGYQAERSYSIANAPGSPEVEIIVERMDAGEVSLWFHDVAAPGDTFEIRGPIGGHFVWTAADGGPLLLLAGGSGVAPLMAMLRYRAHAASHLPALLVYSARTWEGVIFREELLAMDSADPGLDLRFLITGGRPFREADLDRRIDDTVTRQLLTAWGQAPRHVFVCGSNAFVEAATEGVLAAGIPAVIVRTERYG